MNCKVVALFDHRSEAFLAREDLIVSGFRSTEIDVTGEPGTVKLEKTLLERVREFFRPGETDIHQEAGKGGRTILEVSTGEERAEEARRILERHDPLAVDLHGGGFHGEEFQGGSQTGRPAGGFDEFEEDYRKDFNRRHAAAGADFEDFLPAYRYGRWLAREERYHGREWRAIAGDVEYEYETRFPGHWPRHREAIRYGFERAFAHS